MSDQAVVGQAKSETIRILLVEDDAGSALLMQTTLKHWQYGAFIITCVENLAAALDAVARGGIDLVLLDLGLPDSRGLDTFVRMNAAAVHVPIIVLSGLDDEALATQTVQLGAQDYIVKGRMEGGSLARAIRYAIERFRAQQALAAQRDLLRSLIDNLPDQVYLKDMDNRFVSVNPVTARFFGVSSPDAIIGKSDCDFFPGELAAQFLAEEQALLHSNQPCINREAAVKDSAGNTHWVMTTKVPLRDHAGTITGILGMNHDITERKEAEEAIRRLNSDLENRVAARTKDLQRINEQLRQAMSHLEEHDRMMAEFVSSVSHELKTPLASMKWGVSNLLGGVVGSVPDRMTEYLQMLDADCQRMTGTVEDILDLSRLEAKTMHLHLARLPFDRLIRRAVAALRAQAHTKQIELVVRLESGLGFVDCDALKLVRAIINIIGNAVKFTPDCGKVEIGLRREGAVPGFLILEVTDNGIGISAQYLARVTDKYFRIGEHVSGAGLGLPIAKEILELHGARLIVQSPPPDREQGTVVSVIMPAASTPVILLANHDSEARQLLERQLSAFKYKVVTSGDCDDAMELTRRSRPDIAIVDVVGSEKGEMDILLRIKADHDLKNMPIVAVAGGAVSHGKQEMLKGLSIPLLPTPWSEDDLLDRIEAAARGVSLSNVQTA